MTNTTPGNQLKPRLAFAMACLHLALVVGCATENPPITTKNQPGLSKTDSRVQALVGGEAAALLIADLSKAKTCDACRIDGFAREAKDDDPTTLHGYPILSSPSPINDVSRATLSNLLSDPHTYLWDVAKACEFVPGVALRFTRGNVNVDVLVCFSCDELDFYMNGKLVGHEDFDPRRSDLLRVVKKLFPEDEAIQALN